MIIFITGKSGSGKSTLARQLAEKMGYKYVDVDSVGHGVYNIPGILEQAEKLFGRDIFDEDGAFNRKKLGQIVFQERHSERIKDFSDLTWHYMQIEIDKLLKENENIVLDWILFPHTKYWNMLAYKILVKPASDELRFKKLLERDNVKLEYLKLRDKASIEYNESDFNYIIVNDYVEEKNKTHIKHIQEQIEKTICFEVLGTKSPFALADSACPSYFLTIGKTRILLDCGSGSHRFFDMKKLDNLNIIISHLHRDHYNDLYNYMYTAYSLKNLGRLKEKMNIYLPCSPASIVDDIKSEKLTYSNVYTFDNTTKLNLGEATLEFLDISHSNEMDCYAIKIKASGKQIVYTGDLSYSNKERLAKFAKGCDVFISESSFLKGYNFPEINSHITAAQAAAMAKEAKAKRLMLTHFWAEEDVANYLAEAKEVFDNTIALKEQDKFYL